MKLGIKKYPATEVTLTRASNGWIVEGKYTDLYNCYPPASVHTTDEAALKAAALLMKNPHVVEEEVY